MEGVRHLYNVKGVISMRNNGVVVFGLILILIGLIGILNGLEIIDVSWRNIWPLFILVPGLLFELGYFINGRKEPGLLVPGGILITYGALFLFCALYGMEWMQKLWPIFLLGPAVGLFQLYAFGPREKGILIPVGILGLLTAIFLTTNFSNLNIGGMIFPVVLIIVGFIIVISTFAKTTGHK